MISARRAIGAVQGGVEAGQEVVETHLRAARLLGGKTFGHPARGVAEQVFARIGERRQLAASAAMAVECRVLRRGSRLSRLRPGRPASGESSRS
jgi:hypothetical protein